MAAIALLALTGSFRGTRAFSFRTKPLFCSFETFTLYDSYYEYESIHSTLCFRYYCLFSARCTNHAAVLRLCRIRTVRGTSCS